MLFRSEAGEIIEALRDRIIGRVSLEKIKDYDGNVIVDINHEITEELAVAIQAPAPKSSATGTARTASWSTITAAWPGRCSTAISLAPARIIGDTGRGALNKGTACRRRSCLALPPISKPCIRLLPPSCGSVAAIRTEVRRRLGGAVPLDLGSPLGTTPPSRCRRRRQGPPRARVPTLHYFAGDVWLSERDAQSATNRHSELVDSTGRRGPSKTAVARYASRILTRSREGGIIPL